MDMMMATGWFVAGGICERFPDLKVVILEGSGGWMPTMLERFDHQQKVFGNPYQTTLPSEVFQRQCWVASTPTVARTRSRPRRSAPIASCGHPTTRTPTRRSRASSTSCTRRPRSSTPESRRLVNGANAAEFYDL